jgi:acyl-CoA synthetase (AMP-forming)/AMP-acid ligase II/acyl carrier protein
MAVTVHDYPVSPSVTDTASAPTLLEGFQQAVVNAPDAVAVLDGSQSFTWRQWQDHSNAIARGLQDLGVRQGDVVAVQLPNCMEFLALHVAVAMIGAVLLPVHVDCGRADLDSLVGRTKPSVIVLPARWRDSDGQAVGDSLKATVPSLGNVLVAGCPSDVPGSLARLAAERAGGKPDPVDVDPAAPFVLVASSGTTSARPKICIHSQERLLANAATVISDGGSRRSDTVLSASPFSFLFGLLSVHIGILTGARQTLLRNWGVNEFFALAADTEPTVLFAVPTQLRDILAELKSDDLLHLPTLREVRTGGAQVSAELINSVQRSVAGQVVVQWGMSEVGAGTYTRPGDPPEFGSSTIGRPATGARVRVVDETGRHCAAGEIGELQFLSPHMFRGYYGDPELTERAFTTDGWLRTGDMAGIDAAGVVTLHGRAMESINVGGRKVNATEIEQLLADLSPLDAAVVVGRADPRLGEVPVLVCATSVDTEVTLETVTAHLLAKGVANYQLPTSVIVVERLPYTATGKIARRLAAEIAEKQVGGRSPVRSTGTGREQLTTATTLVCDLAAEVIGFAVSPEATFKASGFDSAAGTRLRIALTKATGLELPVSLTFDYPTPAAVASYLVNERNQAHAAATSAEPPSEKSIEDDLIAVVGMGCRLPGDIGSP